jgi:hypothetical protein
LFGTLPAFGFYGRHAEGIALSNVLLRWNQEDLRPAMIFDDVRDLTLDAFRSDTTAGEAPVLWLNDVAGASIRGGRTAAAKAFVRVSGSGSKEIVVAGNDLTRAAQAVEIQDAPRGAVIETGNAVAPGKRNRSAKARPGNEPGRAGQRQP